MKKYIFAILTLSISLILNIDEASAQLRFGVKGGIDVASKKINLSMLNVDNRLGYQIGPTVEFIVPTSGFGADVSVLYARKEYEVKEKLDDASISDYDYISIPVNLKQRIKLGGIVGLFASGGVYGNVKVSGGDIENLNDVIQEYKHKNFVFGLSAGAGVSLLKNFDLGIYFRGDLTKNYGDEYMDAGIFQNKKNQVWSIGLNVYF